MPQALLMWDITNACNQACKHCYNAHFRNNTIYRDADLSDSAIECIYTAIARYKITNLVITGGEPFLRKEIFGLIDKFSSTGVHVSVTSNGTLIDDRMAASIVNSRLNKLAISMESADKLLYDDNRGEGTYTKFIKGVNALHSATMANKTDLYRELSVTVLAECISTESDIIDIYEFATQYGFSGVSFQYPISPGDNWERIENAEHIIRSALNMASISLKYPNIITIIQYKKILVDYCNRVCGSRVRGGKTTCHAGSNIYYMDNRLMIYPCIYQNQSRDAEKRVVEYLNEHGNRCAADGNDELMRINSFNMLKEVVAKMRVGDCDSCEYFDSCYKICPYDFIFDHERAEACFDNVCKLIRLKDNHIKRAASA